MRIIQNPAWKVASTVLTCSNTILTWDRGRMAGKKDGGRGGSVDASTRSQSDLRGGSSGGEVELNKLLKVMIPIEEKRIRLGG
jgi:hypothetical protein